MTILGINSIQGLYFVPKAHISEIKYKSIIIHYRNIYSNSTWCKLLQYINNSKSLMSHLDLLTTYDT